MALAEKELVAAAARSTPKGIPVTVPINVWYEVVLLLKSTKISDIHRLSDIPRNGGAITSQGFPPG